MKNNSNNRNTNIKHNNNKLSCSSSTIKSQQQYYDELEQLQHHLDDLQSDQASIEIVYNSLKNAFLIYPSVELDEVDKEICRAYDDLMAQVRHLDRCLKRLDKSIKISAASSLPSA